MKLILSLLLIPFISLSALAEIPPLPEELLVKMKAVGLEKQGELEVSKDDFQRIFAAGVLEKVFKQLEKVEDASSYQFQDAKGVGVSLMRIRFATPLTDEEIRELSSIEALTLEKSLERMKMAKFFVDFEEPKKPEQLGANYSDSFTYSLQEAGKPDKFTIARTRHYGPGHLVILTTVNGEFKAAELEKWVKLLPETKLQPAPQVDPNEDNAATADEMESGN